MQRISDRDIQGRLSTLKKLCREQGISEPTLHVGNSTYKVPNRLILGSTNVWPDQQAGFTKREAYNALRVMIATLSLVIDVQEGFQP